MEPKRKVCVTLDAATLNRVDAAAKAMGATRSFVISFLVRGGLDRERGEGDALESAPARHPDHGMIVERDPGAIPHIAIAGTLEAARDLAAERGLRWFAWGQPWQLARLMPPLDARAAICTTIEHASELARAPNWLRCGPQLARIGAAA